MIDAGDSRLEVPFQDAMKLEGLAGRDAQRTVAVTARQFVQLQPLPRRADAARHPHPDHEAVGRLQLLPLALVAEIPVVLLIGAVELEQLGVFRGYGAGRPIGQAFLDGSPQIEAARLEVFVFAGLHAFFHHHLLNTRHAGSASRTASSGHIARPVHGRCPLLLPRRRSKPRERRGPYA